MSWYNAYWALQYLPHRALLMSWVWRALAEHAVSIRSDYAVMNATQVGSPEQVCVQADQAGVVFPEAQFLEAMGEMLLVR